MSKTIYNMALDVTYLSVDAKSASEGFPTIRRQGHILAWMDLADVAWEADGELLMPGESEWIGILSILEAERDNPHPNQVTPVDALEALGNDWLHTLFETPHDLRISSSETRSRIGLKSVRGDESITRSNGPFAALSRELPAPYSSPARMTMSWPSDLYFCIHYNDIDKTKDVKSWFLKF